MACLLYPGDVPFVPPMHAPIDGGGHDGRDVMSVMEPRPPLYTSTGPWVMPVMEPAILHETPCLEPEIPDGMAGRMPGK